MIRISMLDDCMEIFTRLLNQATIQTIIETLREYEADYTITNRGIIVKRPNYKILVKLCYISDILLI